MNNNSGIISTASACENQRLSTHPGSICSILYHVNVQKRFTWHSKKQSLVLKIFFENVKWKTSCYSKAYAYPAGKCGSYTIWRLKSLYKNSWYLVLMGLQEGNI